MKIIFFLCAFLVTQSLYSQDGETSKYAIEYMLLTNSDLDTTYKYEYDLEINITSISKRKIKFDFFMNNLKGIIEGRNKYFSKIEGIDLKLHFKRKSNFVKILNYKNITDFKLNYGFNAMVSNTCAYSNLEGYIENYFNDHFFFLNILLENEYDSKSQTFFSKEGTKLNYNFINSLNDNNYLFQLEPNSLEDYCYKIYNCLYDVRVESNEMQLMNERERYENLSAKAKSRISKEDYVQTSADRLDKDLDQMNDFFERSLDNCLDNQEEILFDISFLRSDTKLSEIVINNQEIIFPSFYSDKMYNAKKIIRITKYK